MRNFQIKLVGFTTVVNGGSKNSNRAIIKVKKDGTQYQKVVCSHEDTFLACYADVYFKKSTNVSEPTVPCNPATIKCEKQKTLTSVGYPKQQNAVTVFFSGAVIPKIVRCVQTNI